VRTAWGIACSYALISFLYIYTSDRLLIKLGFDLQANSRVQTYKGTIFVLITSVLLFLVLRRALARAHQGEAFFRKVIETIPMGIWVANAEGKIIEQNSAGHSIWDSSSSSGCDQAIKFTGWWADSGQPIAQDEWGLVRALKKGETSKAEKIHIAGFDGRRKTVLHSAFPLQSTHGLVSGAMVMIQDITEKTKAEEQLRLFQFAIEQSSEAIFWLNRAGQFTFVNEQACYSLGYSRQELMRLLLWEVDPEFSQERWDSQWQSLKFEKQKNFQTVHKRKDGSIMPVEVSAIQCTFNDQEHHIAFVRDITFRKQYEEQLEHQATHDALTGLANRNLLDDRLQQSIIYAERSQRIVAVFLLDLDRFKVINDSLGHSHGDTTLLAVAERLSRCIRPGDTLARLGGDEFVIVFADVGELDEIGLLAQKILNTFTLPFKVDGRELQITTSIGASLYPRDGEDGEDLIRQADAAMYQAKKKGSGLFQLSSAEMNLSVHEALELEADLREAIEKGEFILYYQPKVKISTGCLDGCEALVRWQHPQKGMIAPDSFIPLAEETGLIIPLGSWVIREACRQFKAWEQEGLTPVRIAVNISARQFNQVDFIDRIKAILAEYAMDPHWLDLELTESMVMQDPNMVAKTLVQLKELGFELSLDDFGTGYSSLNYLRRFPIDCLKIDRSFILDVPEDKTAASVANSIIGIAHSLGITAIAEGVETWEQHQFLVNCGCDNIQGFLFSKPLPAEELAQHLHNETRWKPQQA
jgi:diguanylate cyclase (GGDEF)-like protein/PAS domain S-box-containing protein